MKRLNSSLMAFFAVIYGMLLIGVGQAAPGSSITNVPLPVAGFGVSVAVDCDGNVYYTLVPDAAPAPTLYKMDKNGTLLSTNSIVDTNGAPVVIDEMAWDNSRQVLWGGEHGSNPIRIWQITTAGTATFQFTATNSISIGTYRDGLAYDGNDDSIWVSGDVSTDIEHYTSGGAFINSITPKNAVGSPLGFISGVVVGLGDLLYLGHNGFGEIVQVKKSNGDFISSFASPGGRDEGLECDPINFAPKLALWSRDFFFPGSMSVIELEPGTCACGGAPPPGPCGCMDIVFVQDTTGSMGPAINNVKAGLDSIIEAAVAASGGDLRLGLVTFTAPFTCPPDGVLVNQPFTTNTNLVKAAVMALFAFGGNNEPESSDEALKYVVTGATACCLSDPLGPLGSYRTNCVKIAILDTDARPGGCDDAFAAGVDDVNAANVATAAAGAGIKVSAVYNETNPSFSPTIIPIMMNYATTTGGQYVQTPADGSGTGAAIENIIMNCGRAPMITCDVQFFTNDVQVTTDQCGTNANVGVPVGTPVQVKVQICADAGNAQSVSNCNVDLTADGVPLGRCSSSSPLAPGDCGTLCSFSFTCVTPGVHAFAATVTCSGGAMTSCSNTLECCVPPSSGCRVTGGGIVTNTYPKVLNATFGGQVGAPVGAPTSFSTNSACIQGEWQHLRHIRGNPTNCTSTSKCGNFHARSFDSLMCACLGCADGGLAPQTNMVCNPDDRICGPEPRQAPANKICFSGVGDYALNKGKRTPRIAVFRVDIEDRGEPGGDNGTPPPDRYRIRIWFVSNADSPSSLALRQAVSCSNPLSESVNAPPPDIDDGGDLTRGNLQIHPQIGPCP